VATIYVDGEAYEVNPNNNLLDECLTLGFNLPYFCWHPAMGSVGACRQCAIKQFKDENDKQGRIVMACMTPASDGTRISISDPEAVEFRASVIEWLMTNHPHDCPICDEGGECHLQDMTVMTGHNYRRYRFNKRTHLNQYLGPFINHEMNRCIQCYRCVRFYQEQADGRDFDVFAAHNHVYFGRHEEGVLESEFSGNLVEVCPTGVFTDKSLKRHYTRKWDLTTAPSICVNCSVGCNTIPGERYGSLRRIRNRYNQEVNGYFLCDRGRYGYEFVNDQRRIRQPLARQEGSDKPQQVTQEEANRQLQDLLSGEQKIIGIGSPRASLEANFALRTMVGAENFYAGVSQNEHQLTELALKILRQGPARSPSLHDIGQSDVVFVLGEDVTNTAPMVAFALRRAAREKPKEKARERNINDWDDAAVREIVQNERGPFYVATPTKTKLDDIATKTYRAAPQDLARLGYAIAHLIDPKSPEVSDLPEALASLAQEIAKALQEAEKPVIVSGTSCGSPELMQAAANIAWALSTQEQPAALCYTYPESNSVGFGMMGAKDLQAAAAALKDGGGKTLIILENDLYRRENPAFVDDLLQSAQRVITIDHLENATTAKADLVVPTATFAEGDGTLVSNEGRAQRFFQVYMPQAPIQESWRWVRDMIKIYRAAESLEWNSLDDILNNLAEALPEFKSVTDIAPPASFRIDGEKVPRQSFRFSGRTSMLANINVSEPKPPDDPDSALAFSMEGYEGNPPPPLIPRYWAPGWNSVQALNKFQAEVGGPLKGGDPGMRLIEPAQAAKKTYFNEVPQAFKPEQDKWLILPLYHIYGSEELSVLSPGVAERMPVPYLGLNSDEAAERELEEGQPVQFLLGEMQLELQVKFMDSLPHGVAGLPAGLPDTRGFVLPDWGSLKAR
jgi:NADH-quinone oxidoreductase subunit G